MRATIISPNDNDFATYTLGFIIDLITRCIKRHFFQVQIMDGYKKNKIFYEFILSN